MVRPKDLAPPFGKESPQVTIHDKVWYLPVLADTAAFSFPGWSSPALFGNDRTVHLEFCSGNGSWVIEKAQQQPEKNWLAVEKSFERVRKIWAKITNLGLTNILVAHAEGIALSAHYFPASSISSLYINFPDPWPKKRHAKHRIICPALFEEAVRGLASGGKFVFVTDEAAYSSSFLELLEQEKDFENVCPPPGFRSPPAEYGTSFFDSLFRQQGKAIFYHELRKIHA